MIPMRLTRKRPSGFGCIGSSTTYPPETKGLPENTGKAGLPHGIVVGLNDFEKVEYGGPCPPIGRHRYFHKLYALDITLGLKGATKPQIEQAMKDHLLANAELIGTYQKGDR